MSKYTYLVMGGSWGGYGQSAPVSRKRAKSLIKRVAYGREKHPGYGYAFNLSVIPNEVSFCHSHGAAPKDRLLVWKNA